MTGSALMLTMEFVRRSWRAQLPVLATSSACLALVGYGATNGAGFLELRILLAVVLVQVLVGAAAAAAAGRLRTSDRATFSVDLRAFGRAVPRVLVQSALTAAPLVLLA